MKLFLLLLSMLFASETKIEVKKSTFSEEFHIGNYVVKKKLLQIEKTFFLYEKNKQVAAALQKLLIPSGMTLHIYNDKGSLGTVKENLFKRREYTLLDANGNWLACAKPEGKMMKISSPKGLLGYLSKKNGWTVTLNQKVDERLFAFFLALLVERHKSWEDQGGLLPYTHFI